MRISCDVDVVNRLLPSHNMKKAARACRAQLSIGRKPGNGPLKDGTLFLMLCTAKDKNGAKYQIKGNIEQVFNKFVDEGKATIRLKDPQQDICISKADKIHLRSFLSVLRLAIQGRGLEAVTLSSLAPACSRNVEKPRTSLVVLSRKEYPLTTNFPGTLEHLQVSECRMKRIDSRIFKLRNLVRLDLSRNSIETIHDDITQLKLLSELKLSHNSLASFPSSVCLVPSLQNTLTSLDLTHNKIQQLPLQICEIVSLVTLKVDGNEMENLPPTIGRLVKLKFLTASGNKLRSLPAGFMRLRLESVDLFGNSFDLSQETIVAAQTVALPTLVECAARSIRKYRVPYNEDELHVHLCRMLDSARHCWCGNYCFHSSVRYTTKVDLRGTSSTVTAVDLLGGTSVPVEGFLCSPQCLAKFQHNPHAYWR